MSKEPYIIASFCVKEAQKREMKKTARELNLSLSEFIRKLFEAYKEASLKWKE